VWEVSGTVSLLNTSDLSEITSFSENIQLPICCCELEDGSFVVGGFQTMKRWNREGEALQTFYGHSDRIRQVIELRKDNVVSASNDETLKIRRVSSGECLRTLKEHSNRVTELVKLSGKFVSWGYCIQTIATESYTSAMARMGNEIVVATSIVYRITVRRLK